LTFKIKGPKKVVLKIEVSKVNKIGNSGIKIAFKSNKKRKKKIWNFFFSSKKERKKSSKGASIA